MSHNASPVTGTPVYTPGKFGNGMSGGGLVASGTISSANGTASLQCLLPNGDSGLYILLNGPTGYLATQYGGLLFNGSSGNRLNASGGIADGAYHHVEIDFDGTNVTIYADGVQVAQGAQSTYAPMGNNWGSLNIGTQGGGFVWPGQIDEVAIYSAVQHTANFTPPTTSTLNNAANLLALYHLQSDGTDSAGLSTPTGYVLTSATSSATVGVADTITATLSPEGTVGTTDTVIALSDTLASTFSGTITIPAGSISGTAQFTPSTGGSHVISGTHTGGGFSGGDGSITLVASGSSNLSTSPTSFAPSLLQHSIFLTSVAGAYSSGWNPTMTGPTGFQLVSHNYLTGECFIIPGSAAGTININDGTYTTTVPVSGAAPNYIAPNATGIQYYGPWAVSSSLATVSYPGNTVEIAWTGDYIDIGFVGELTPSSFIVEVDGEWQARITGASLTQSPVLRVSPRYNSTTPLHVLAHSLVLWVEGADSNNSVDSNSIPKIVGYELPAGGAILPKLPAAGLAVVIGDSIACGIAELAPPGTTATQEQMAAHTAFPAVCTSAMGLKSSVVAVPGQTVATMTTQFQASYPSTPAIQPVIVPIYLGSNHPELLTQADCQALFAAIRTVFHNTVIVAFAPYNCSPSVYPLFTAAAAAIGDAKIFVRDYTSGVYGNSDTFDGLHPNIGGDVKLGTKMAYDCQTILNTLGIGYGVQGGGGGSGIINKITFGGGF